MGLSVRRLHTPFLLFGFVVLASTAGCGSNASSSNVAGPSLSRCAISISGSATTMSAAGGNGTVNVSAERECSWSARAETWISLSAAAGQGATALTYSVQPNPTAIVRRGNIVVAEQRLEIVQDAAPCRFGLTPSSLDILPEGGTADVTLDAPAGCGWTAESATPWITVEPRSGSGAAKLRVVVDRNAAAARAGRVSVGDATIAVQQSGAGTAPPQCLYQITPTRVTLPASGAALTVTITSTTGCGWATSTEVSWVELAGSGSGTGNGSVRLQVQANTGGARTGIVRVAGQTVTIDQAAAGPAGPSCEYTISPPTRALGAEAQEVTVDVRAEAGCGWTATSRASWISVRSGDAGSGNGSVRLSIGANGGESRTGTVLVAGRSFTVQQGAAAPCTFSLKPASYEARPEPDDLRITVNTTQQCAWTASSPVNWATISEGSSGTGPGTVRVLVARNPGAARTATLTVASQPFALSQEAPCDATLKPTTHNAGPGADDFKVQVKVDHDCAWTASSPVSWATIVEGASESGNKNVRIRVEANAGAARSTTLTIAGLPFTLTQDAARR